MDIPFTKRIKKIIELAGSAEALAYNSGMSSRVIGQYLSGKSDPTRKKLISLARAANVNIEWLVTGQGPMNKDEVNSLVNSNLLTAIIEVLEEYIIETKEVFTPLEKAEAISAAYEMIVGEKINETNIKEVVKEAIDTWIKFHILLNDIANVDNLEKIRKLLRKKFKIIIKNKNELEEVIEDLIGVSILRKKLKEGSIDFSYLKKEQKTDK